MSLLRKLGLSAPLVTLALAGFDPDSQTNIAVYWGQNSYNQANGPYVQERLSYYCANSDIDIIPIAFMNGITPVVTNFANAGDNCTKFADNSNILDCPQIEEDIKSCQKNHGKTILISLGGATYYQGGFSTASQAETAAEMVWNMFGPVSSGSGVDRPFGTAVVDGVDFDFENPVNNLPAFAARMRKLMDAATAGGDKKYYLSAAPQCVFPDGADGAALDAVAFDLVMVQSYNNWCGVVNFKPGAATQNAFNFDVWDNWAKKTSPNPDVKILLGVPANTGAGGGYTEGPQLASAISYSKGFSSFGGAMLWDMSQLYANEGFLAEVVKDVAAPASSTPPTGGGGDGGTVPQYGQCGGEGYTGATKCQSPYTCVAQGPYWSSCQ